MHTAHTGKYATRQTSAHDHTTASGQILVEVMIALSIMIVSLTGFYGLLKSSLQLIRTTSDNYIATHLAVEGVEIVANLIQENYVDSAHNALGYFNKGIAAGDHEIDYTTKSITSSMLFNKTKLKFDGRHYQYDSGSETPFSRLVQITYGSDALSVVSNVYVNDVLIATARDTFQNWWRQ